MSDLLRYRDDAAPDAATVTLADFVAGGNAVAVRIMPGEDVRALLPHLDRLALVAIAFPGFRDGRGFSAASILREAGYVGELRATGDVLVDQIVAMRRCGFDAFAPSAPLDPVVVERALTRYAFVYSWAADRRAPVWALRHG